MRRCFCIVVFWIHAICLFGQSLDVPTTSQSNLLEVLEQDLRKGKKKALRDIGTLLDQSKLQEKARRIIRQYCLFHPQQFQLNQNFNRSKFLDFYYSNDDKIYYDDLINAFVTSDPIEWKINQASLPTKTFQATELKNIIISIQEKLEKKQFNAISVFLEKLKYHKNERCTSFLASLIKQLSTESNTKALYEQIAEVLTFQQHEKALFLLIEMTINGHLSKVAGNHFVSLSSNVQPKSKQVETWDDDYKKLIDSLSSYEAMRFYGYSQHFSFSINQFEHEVDFLGRVLSLSDGQSFLHHNACLDLMAVAHSRALYYLGAQFYKYRNSEAKDLKHIHIMLNRLTGQKLSLADSNNAEKLLYHWIKTYKDYEWSADYQQFVDIKTHHAQKESYEKLFRRLNSKNDSIAMVAFRTLACGDPVQIKNLHHKYTNLIRSYNKQLPDIKFEMLPMLSKFHKSMEAYGYDLTLRSKLKSNIALLKTKLSHKERMQLEDILIQKIIETDLVALEFEGFMNQKNKDFNYSINNILNQGYQRYFEDIQLDDNAFRAYLKKANLFQNSKIQGGNKDYIKRLLPLSEQLKKQLSSIKTTESDEDILSSIQLIQHHASKHKVEHFIEYPTFYNNFDIQKIKVAPSTGNMLVFEAIQSSKSNQKTGRYLQFFKLHSNLELTPFLIKLLDNQVSVFISNKRRKTIRDFAIEMLCTLHEINLGNKTKDEQLVFWKQKWQSEQQEYLNWGKNQYSKNLKRLASNKSIHRNLFNAVSQSSYFTKNDLPILLSALSKLEPKTVFKSLRFPTPLKMNQLSYFESLAYDYKSLDYLPRLFEINDSALLLAFLTKKTATFSNEEKASFYNNIFRQQWFDKGIIEGTFSKETLKQISSCLTKYLQEADLLSEYEEQKTLLNIMRVQFAGLSLLVQLQQIDEQEMDTRNKHIIRTFVLSRLSYESIGEVVNYLFDLNNADTNIFDFIQKDFGLPLTSFENRKIMQSFVEEHDKLNQKAFYQYIFEEANLMVYQNNQLDEEKVWTLIEKDNVKPFAGNQGRREIYTYGLIKLLELQHDTTLDFHEKLNENQNHFSHTCQERLDAWRKFLKR